MKLRIDDAIFKKFPGLEIGAVAAKGVGNSGADEGIMARMREEEQRIRADFNPETLSQHPRIDAWRKAYSAFGGKPKENRSSVENLYRLVLKGGSVRHISKLVDIYNYVSLKHMLPVGGEDLGRVKGDIVLCFAVADGPPVLLLGEKEPRPPHGGEVIYKDDVSAICRRWNWKEADRTKLTEETRDCVLVIEGLPPVKREEVEAAAKELGELVRKVCGGEVNGAVLSESRPEIEL